MKAGVLSISIAGAMLKAYVGPSWFKIALRGRRIIQ